jgi:uncharacterized delta-60 repeat protein
LEEIMKYLKFILVTKLLFLFSSFVWAQESYYDTAWVRRYNGPGNFFDYAYAIAVDDSGNVYVTGESYGNDTIHYDFATIKYYHNGDTAWVRRYNGPGNQDDEAYAIAVDCSGNVYVTGLSYGNGTSSDYVTIKYYPSGDTAWLRRYDGPANGFDAARALTVDGSGIVYVTGGSYGVGTDGDFTTIKYYPNGDTAWIRRYDGSEHSSDFSRAIAVDASGNIYVTGASWEHSDTGYDYATIKYDPNGNQLWVSTYNGPGNSVDIARSIAADDFGNVYVTGESHGNGTSDDYVTVKYYPYGDTAWVRRYNGPGNGIDHAYAMALDSSGNVYITGWSDGGGTENDYATIKYYPDGDTAWVRRYNGPGDYDDEALAIAVDSCGNVYVTGYSWNGTDFDYATVKYDSSGNQLWVAIYDGSGNGDDRANAIAVCGCDTVYVTGESQGSGTDKDYVTIKYVQKETFVEGYEDQNQIRLFTLYQNYPNPFNPVTTIEYALPKDSRVEICIYDILGRKVRTLVDEYQLAGCRNVIWDSKNDEGAEVATGIYFLRIQAGDFVQSKKMLLVK